MDVDNQHLNHGLSQVVVIVVPFTCQSHLNQLLQLSCLISSYNIPVHYASTALHIRQAKLRFNGTNNLENTNNIYFHEFPTPPFLSPPPNPNGSTKFPAHLQSSFDATVHLRDPVAKLLQRISPKARRVIVIHDFNMSYVVQDTTTLPNAESFLFNPISAFTYFFSGWEMKKGKFLEVQAPEGLPSEEGCITDEILKFTALQSEFMGNIVGTIFNSCRSIEGTYIDLLAKEHSKQIWAVGPLNLGTTHNSNSDSKDHQHKCLEWLDKQTPNSVLYISFGTTTSMTDEQIQELAMGLEQSEQKFIWVLREADKGDIFGGDEKRAQLPEGYEERVKEVGLVVRDWAPQIDILAHPSTGGFMSHCGWNSCLESMTMGVPIAAWPMHSDQPRNAFLVTDILKVGVSVNQWTPQEGLVTSSTIANAVKRLIASKEGEDIRKRAKELGGATRHSVKEGGVSRKELDSFITHITR